MAIAMSSLSTSCVPTNYRTSICLSTAKPTCKFSLIPIPKGKSTMPICCGRLSTSRLQSNKNMVWSMESHKTMQTKEEFQQRRGKLQPRAVAEEEGTQLASEDAQEEQQSVTAVVSQSDKLIMHFKAEGVLAESLVPKVTQALEAVEDVSDVSVEIVEGTATIGLVKETSVQATGVASGLVELLQGMDFKLQSLSLMFEDEEDLEDLQD